MAAVFTWGKTKRKTKETNLKKYGDEIYFKTEDKKIKSIITNNKKLVLIIRHNLPQREKIKKTNFKNLVLRTQVKV